MENEQPKKATRSRRKTRIDVLSSDASGLSSNYCRKCRRLLPEAQFYKATDLVLDTNGKMSVCKSCCEDLYNSFYSMERTLDKATYRVCKTINVVYSELALDKLKTHLDTSMKRGKNVHNPFGFYMSKIQSTVNNDDLVNLTFMDNIIENRRFEEDLIDTEYDIDEISRLKKKWGNKYSIDELTYLEDKLSKWDGSHGINTYADEVSLINVCRKQLEIDTANEQPGSDTSNLVKQLSDLMKMAGVDPKETKTAVVGKSKETFSNFIKIIEETEPAEYYKDKGLFKDFDNLNFYFRKYVTRPLGNFLRVTRDFDVSENEDENDDFDVLDQANDE